MNKPRLLIVGASGFLGQHIAREAASCFDVFAADLTAPPGERGIAMDVTLSASVDEGFARSAPDAVVLLAAVSDIDDCERRPKIAEAVNVRGAAHVSEACSRSGTRLVCMSSAAVFDGKQHGYREADPPTPASVYGVTKARAEKLILQTLPSALIVRLALVLGFAASSGTNAMLNKFAAKLRAGEPVSFPDFEYRNPIDAGTLSRFLLELLSAGEVSGVLHVGATESISRYDLAVRLACEMGYGAHLVRRQTQPVPGRAPRGLDHFLLTDRLRAVCRTPVPSCGEVIEKAIHESTQGN